MISIINRWIFNAICLRFLYVFAHAFDWSPLNFCPLRRLEDLSLQPCSKLVLWRPTHGRARQGRPRKSYIDLLVETRTWLSRISRIPWETGKSGGLGVAMRIRAGLTKEPDLLWWWWRPIPVTWIEIQLRSGPLLLYKARLINDSSSA